MKTICEHDCIPVCCVPPACCPYLPACTVPGGMPRLWSRGGSTPGGRGSCSWGCLPLVLEGGLLLGRGACIWSEGGVVSQHAMGQTPFPVNRILETTLLKILPCPHFVAGGNKTLLCSVAHPGIHRRGGGYQIIIRPFSPKKSIKVKKNGTTPSESTNDVLLGLFNSHFAAGGGGRSRSVTQRLVWCKVGEDLQLNP